MQSISHSRYEGDVQEEGWCFLPSQHHASWAPYKADIMKERAYMELIIYNSRLIWRSIDRSAGRCRKEGLAKR